MIARALIAHSCPISSRRLASCLMSCLSSPCSASSAFETASFAALLVGVGLAIGAAWSGLLANFAAGFFLLVLRPFKAGDYVEVGGVTGTVETIGLFTTTLNTPANVVAIVGNAKVFGDTIQNYTRNDYRRVDLTVGLSHDVDPSQAIALLKDGITHIANVLPAPAPTVEVFEFTLAGPILVRSPFLRQRALLASLFRHEPNNPEYLRQSWLPASGISSRGARQPRRRRSTERENCVVETAKVGRGADWANAAVTVESR